MTDRSRATSVSKVFAAGDAARGQSLVVRAIADGRRVAAGVHAALAGTGRTGTKPAGSKKEGILRDVG